MNENDQVEYKISFYIKGNAKSIINFIASLSELEGLEVFNIYTKKQR